MSRRAPRPQPRGGPDRPAHAPLPPGTADRLSSPAEPPAGEASPSERVAIYRRISTDPRLQQWSLAAQAEALGALAAARGWRVVRDEHDEESGSRSDRPGLRALLDAMGDGDFARVLVVDQDRLSRLEPIAWELVKRAFRDAGCRLVTPAGEVDFGDEDQELVSDVFNLFARHQRRKIRKATARGRLQAFRAGRWLAPPPWGYLRIEGRLRPDPTLAPVVRAVFERYAAGESAAAIARSLAARGLARPRGGRWDARRIGQALRSPAYRGCAVARFGGERVAIEGSHPGIVPPELWWRCQEVADGRRRRHAPGPPGRGRGLLAGIARCAACGRPLVARTLARSKPGGRRYVYTYYRHRGDDRWHAPACPTAVRADAVDAAVRRALAAAARAPANLARYLRWLADPGGADALAESVERVDEALAALARRRQLLLDLYLDGGCSRGEFDARLGALARHEEAERYDRAALAVRLKERRAAQAAAGADRAAQSAYLAAAGDLAGMDAERQRRLVRCLVACAEIDGGGRVRLVGRSPGSRPSDGPSRGTPTATAGRSSGRTAGGPARAGAACPGTPCGGPRAQRPDRP